MNQDYKNFGERMGSFEDTMDVSGEELVHNTLTHYGVLGMKWGHRKSASSSSPNRTIRKENKKIQKADKEWEKGINNQTKSKALINKIQKDPQYHKDINAVVSKLTKSGLKGDKLQAAFHNKVMEKFNDRLLKDPDAYNPSKTKVMLMMNVATPSGTMAKPMAIDVDRIQDPPKIKHGEIADGELYHYGVLGMKWGRRKGINATTIGAAARTGQTVTNLGQTINKSGTNKKSLAKAKNLSDEELKKLTARLNLENNYVNANTQQSGKSKVEGILTIAGGVLATASSAAILYDTIKKFK